MLSLYLPSHPHSSISTQLELPNYHFSFTVYFLIVSVVSCLGLFLYKSLQTSKKQSPPGPPTLPLIGNLHQAPTTHPERIYQQWGKIYGPIMQLQYGLQTVIVLGTNAIAQEILDKRGSIYSSRPRMVQSAENQAKGFHPLFMSYGPQFRLHQRLFSSYINPRISQTYTVLQDLESKQMILDLLTSNDFAFHFRRLSGSMAITLAYGKRFPRGDEPELLEIGKVMENVFDTCVVGKWIVDSIPILNYLPRFLAPWKRHADKLHDFEKGVHTKNYDQAVKSPSWNWCKQVSSREEARIMSHTELAYNTGIIFGAASDTTSLTLQWFIMAMILHPHVAQKAQAEIDQVVGSTRLPTFEDKTRLPYITAIMQEVMRWRPIVPGGMPHAVSQDDTYMGYHIPTGSVIIPNIWAITREEKYFPNPDDFNPDRWIDNPDLPVSAWGYGRRVCQGKVVAQNTLFIAMVRVLWAFEVRNPLVERDGCSKPQVIDSLDMKEALVTGPGPFKAEFRVRSLQKETVVRREWEAIGKDTDVLLEGIHRAQLEIRG